MSALPPGGALDTALRSIGPQEPQACSMEPWVAYDKFVQGTTVQELALSGTSDGYYTTEEAIWADIRQMRDWQRERLPGLSDEELDSYRRITLVARLATVAAAQDSGAAAALKVLKECQDKQEELARISGARAFGDDL